MKSDSTQLMRIARVQPDDVAGGAERMAQRLHDELRRRGHLDHVYVGHKRGQDPDVMVVDNRARQRTVLGASLRAFEHLAGIPFTYYPGTRKLIDRLARYDLVHLHNLHGDFFEIRRVPALSRRVPVVLTLHDLFWATGHCAQPMDCPRWAAGCGRCPDLARYPMVHRDATAFLRRYKRDLLARSQLQIIAPTQWIRDRWQAAGMQGPAPVVVPRGLDLGIYRPGDRRAARERLGLAPHGQVVLFSAQGGLDSPYKDGATVLESLRRLVATRPSMPPTLLVMGGGHASIPPELQAHVHQTGFLDGAPAVVRCYQAADVLLHATRADNSPLVIIEAMACGLPVVATDVGGIRELIDPGQTGALCRAGDAAGLAAQLAAVLDDPGRAAFMRTRARERARSHHDLQLYVDRVLDVYRVAREGFRPESARGRSGR